MPAPTFAQLASGLQAFVRLYEEGRKFAEINTRNVVTDADALAATIVTDYLDQYGTGITELRNRLSAYLDGGNQFIDAWLKDYARFLDLPAGSDRAFIFRRIYDDFITNTRRVKALTFSYGTPTANGSNSGNGAIRRLTVDARNHAIQSGMRAGSPQALMAEAKAARCITDANSGANRRGEEVFEFRGADKARDALSTLGSGRRITIPAVHSRSSLILNPSFDSRGGTDAAPTSVTSWSASVTVSAANVQFSTAQVYLPSRNANETVRAMRMRTTQTWAQRLDVSGRALDRNAAYYAAVAWNRSLDACSGTLVMRLGNTSNSVTIAAQTGWNILEVTSSPGQGNWFERFNRNQLSLQLAFTRVAGTLYVDDVFFTPFVFGFDGTGYVVRPGNTPFQAGTTSLQTGDEFTWTDSISASGVIQRWLDRKGLGFLPHSTSATLADP